MTRGAWGCTVLRASAVAIDAVDAVSVFDVVSAVGTVGTVVCRGSGAE